MILDAVDLTLNEALALTTIAFVSGIVRGFTGIALSAVAMATAVLFLPPVEIIPMLWWLEMAASVLMVRSGWREANRGIALGLVLGSSFGLPLGLWLTLSLPIDVSKLVALAIICGLAAAQLARLRLGFLASKPGLIGTGVTAGAVSGLARVGGMIVALYVLALEMPARVIRASLVLFLFATLCVSFFTHVVMGTMDATAGIRGVVFAIPTMAGVLLGKALFVPRYEPYYKPICLGRLIAIALAGIAREGAGLSAVTQ